MDRRELAARLRAATHLTGNFVLRSGQTSTQYFDKYAFESDPVLLRAVAEALLPLVPAGTEVLAGLELGGVPIATALALASGVPAAFVRKARKAYGTCRIAEGCDLAGKRVCIIEDVITTGGQVVASARDLRNEGAIVTDVCCAIYRGEGDPDLLEGAGLTLHALYTGDELLAATRITEESTP